MTFVRPAFLFISLSLLPGSVQIPRRPKPGIGNAPRTDNSATYAQHQINHSPN